MDLRILEKEYMTIAATYAKIVGLWPSQTTSRRLWTAILMYIAAAFGLTTQVARAVVYFSLDIVLEQIPYMFVPLCLVIKHIGYNCNYTKFKGLFKSILDDWQSEMTLDERKIMERSAKTGTFYAFIYAANAYFVSLLFFFVPLLPHILDIMLPLNESRRRMYMFEAYYFTENQDNYYYYITPYTLVGLLVCMVSYIGSDTILIYVVQHCCGLLSLAGHRFENSLQKWSTTTNHTKMDYRNMYKAVILGIRTHQRALTFLIEIESAYKLSLFLLVGVSCITLTATLWKAGTVTFSLETYQFYGYLVAQLIHMFFLTAQGQFIMNVHDSVYQKGYNALWYNADLKTQTLFILILRQNLTAPMLTAGGLMQLNLDTFATILKTSVSYFTVLKSV